MSSAAYDRSRAALLSLLAWLPLCPLDHLPALAPDASARAVRTLVAEGAVRVLRWPRDAGPAWRLLYLTPTGTRMAAVQGGLPPERLARARRLRPADLVERVPEARHLLATYELLACLVATWPTDARLLGWVAPWSRRVWRPTSKARVRLRAHAYVAWATTAGVQARVLWVDREDQAVRDAVGQLTPVLDLHAVLPGRAPVLLVAVPTEARARAWREGLAAAADRRGLPPVPTVVATWPELRRHLREPHDARRGPLPRARRWAGVQGLTGGQDLCDLLATPASALARVALALRPADWRLLVFIARHAFATRPNLVRATGWTRRSVALATQRLRHLGLAQVVPGLPPDERPLECLAPGLALAAAHMGLPLSVAMRKRGFAGGGETPMGHRQSLAGALAHTVGCDRIFAWLIAYARNQQAMGSDEALEVWHNAVECRLRYARPDGYGVYRVRTVAHGFFLEYDRGTENLRDYEQKLAAYHLDLEQRTYTRDYVGFPRILFVAESERAEDLLVAAARRVRAGRADHLPLLLTTAAALTTAPRGLREAVWRTVDAEARQPWPPLLMCGRVGSTSGVPPFERRQVGADVSPCPARTDPSDGCDRSRSGPPSQAQRRWPVSPAPDRGASAAHCAVIARPFPGMGQPAAPCGGGAATLVRSAVPFSASRRAGVSTETSTGVPPSSPLRPTGSGGAHRPCGAGRRGRP